MDERGKDSSQKYSYRDPPVSRRELLALTSGGMAIALAGCTGAANRGESGESGASTGEAFTGALTGHQSTSTDIQFNPYNITLETSTRSQTALFPYLAVQSLSTTEWIPVAAKDWSIDGTSLTVQLLDGFTWHNGDPVTIDDLERTLKLSAHMNSYMSDYVESADDITASNDTTVTVNLSSMFNSSGLYSNVFGNIRIDVPEAVFGSYMEEFSDATTEKERDRIRKEVGEFNWREPEPHASGPFELDSITTQALHCTQYDDYPIAEVQKNIKRKTGYDLSTYGTDPNYSEMEYQLSQTRNKVTQLAISDTLDGGDGLDIDSKEELQQKFPQYAEYRQIPTGYGTSIMFNMIDGAHADAWRDQRVRKAFAHIIDLEGVAQQFYGDFTDTRRRFSGLTPVLEQKLFDEAFRNSLTTYDHNPEKAAALLRDAGYTKDKWWIKPNGEPLKATFQGPTSVEYYLRGWQVAASNLRKFGIKSQVVSIEGTTFFSKTLGNLEWDLTRSYYGSIDEPSAYDLSWIRYDGPEEHEYSWFLEQPHDEAVVTVPPIGKPDSNKTITINITDTYNELTKTIDPDMLSTLSKRLSWAFNQTVPKIPIGQVNYSWYMTSDSWNYPAKDHSLGNLYPFTWSLPQIGALQRKSA
ncbi:ABC transporter substrate-binding protein [Halocatena marina]|uniref:ABC transporter substrate-binding protein n=2 Tax=Halocatena marina TaxID=2934937 RepID=A0ABD5YKL0_9EURY|nr:ABC transporter substrate-binding protein [Halocatena marina]